MVNSYKELIAKSAQSLKLATLTGRAIVEYLGKRVKEWLAVTSPLGLSLSRGVDNKAKCYPYFQEWDSLANRCNPVATDREALDGNNSRLHRPVQAGQVGGGLPGRRPGIDISRVGEYGLPLPYGSPAISNNQAVNGE